MGSLEILEKSFLDGEVEEMVEYEREKKRWGVHIYNLFFTMTYLFLIYFQSWL